MFGIRNWGLSTMFIFYYFIYTKQQTLSKMRKLSSGINSRGQEFALFLKSKLAPTKITSMPRYKKPK